MTFGISVWYIVVAASAVIAALVAVQRRKDSVPRILVALVLASIFLVLTWRWTGQFRECRLIGGSFTYCASK